MATATATKTRTVQKAAPTTPKRPPVFRIEQATKRERHLKLLIYGNYGVGKTTLAGTCVDVPQMQDVIMINIEAGDLSLGHHATLDVVNANTFSQLARVHEFLKVHCQFRDEDDEEALRNVEAQLRECDPEDIKEPRRYRTVIVDTLSEAEAYSFNQLLGVTDTTKLDADPQSAEWKEYKQNHGMILRLVRAFRDLPMHVIFTCGEQYNQDESKRYKYSPDLTGKLSKKVQGFMDMVGYLVVGAIDENGNIPRRLYVHPSGTGKYDAKHRYQAFKGDHFDNPTIESILKQVGLHDGAADLK